MVEDKNLTTKQQKDWALGRGYISPPAPFSFVLCLLPHISTTRHDGGLFWVI